MLLVQGAKESQEICERKRASKLKGDGGFGRISDHRTSQRPYGWNIFST